MWNNRIETAPENDGEVFGYIYPGKATAGYGKYCNGVLCIQWLLAFGKIYRKKT